MPHRLQPRSIYVVPMPTCTAWRSRCRFQEPPAAISLNPQQNTHSLMESAITMIFKWCPITISHNHPSRVPFRSILAVHAKTDSLEPRQWHTSVSQCYPGSRHGIPN